MSPPTFPHDVLEEILSQLSPVEDRSFLQSLCLVSRGVRDVCQGLLFSSLDIVVDVKNTEGRSRLERLRNSLQSNTRLLSHVHEVRLTILQSHEFYTDRIQPIILAVILNLLGASPIHTFKIPFVAGRTLGWICFSENTRTALLRIFNNPTFRELSISALSVPSNFFDSFERIRDLEFLGLLIDDFSMSNQHPPIQGKCKRQHRVSRLKVLRPLTFAWRKTVDCIGPSIGLDIGHLEYLALSASDLRYTAHFFALKSLKEFWIGQSHWMDDTSTFNGVAFAPPLELGALTSLVRLSICGRYATFSRQLFPFLKRSLSSFPHHHPSLQFISFGIETNQEVYRASQWSLSHELFDWLATFCDEGRLTQIAIELWFPIRSPESETDAWKEEAKAEALKEIAWKGPKDALTFNIKDFNVFPMWG
ncbi:hypothetical protein BDN72DRAFT_843018 [Pluteus cervinus]|uniref:Uncharacterized protein n=1 Tax=Pluteus cervinus TaxID=181527 RepID=A0ACD3APG8_9AGAR|nr:hypothetical protein BDN72DRAFT_843018 [Pluteus cervinus]